jgi:hypothetical protein
LSYQWQQDGYVVEGATDSTLNLDDIADSDAGYYTVVISNVVGSVTSSPAILVTVPPLIVTQPASVTVLAGQPANFSVGVNGAVPFSYQWVKNTTNVAGGTNRVFIIANTAAGDAGSYQVLVSNPDGSQMSQIATLAVLNTPAPSLTIISYSNNVSTVALTGVTGWNYAIQGSSNLFDWIPVITNPAPYTLVDTNATTSDKYYRGVYLP